MAGGLLLPLIFRLLLAGLNAGELEPGLYLIVPAHSTHASCAAWRHAACTTLALG